MSSPATQKIKPVMDVMDTESEKFATILRLTLLELRNHSPFFGVLATEMWIAGPSESVKTICVSPRGVVVYNDKWMRSLSVGEMIGVLIHEALHVALDYWVRFNGMNPKMGNWAHDFAINDIIKTTLPELHLARTTVKERRAIKITLPEGGLYDPKFSKMSGEEIYVHLEKEVKAKAEQYKHHIQQAIRKMAAEGGKDYDREQKIKEGLHDSMVKALKEFEAKKEQIRQHFDLNIKAKERHEFENLLKNSDQISLTHGESVDDSVNNPFADGGKNSGSSDSWNNAAPKKEDQNDSFNHQQPGEKPEPTPEQKKLQEAQDKMVEGFGHSLEDYMEREYNRLGDIEDGNQPESTQREHLDELRKDLNKHGDEYVDEVTKNGLEEEAAKKPQLEDKDNGQPQPGNEGQESNDPGQSGESGEGQKKDSSPERGGEQSGQEGAGKDQEGGQPGQSAGKEGDQPGQSGESGQQPGNQGEEQGQEGQSGDQPGQPSDGGQQPGEGGQSSGQQPRPQSSGQAGSQGQPSGQQGQGSAQPGQESQPGAGQNQSSSMPGQESSGHSADGGQPSAEQGAGSSPQRGGQEQGRSGGNPSTEPADKGAEQGAGSDSLAGNQPQGQISEQQAQGNVADQLEAMANEMRKSLRGEENSLGQDERMGTGERMADQDAWERAMDEVGKQLGAGPLDGDIMLDDDDIPGNPFKGEDPNKTQERQRQTLANAVRTDKAQGGTGWGSLPAWAQDQIEGILNPPLSFDQHIKKEIGNYGAKSMTTFKKPNKRNSFAPNRPLLPGKKKNESRVYILMDTSGSMFNENDLDNLRMAYGLIKRLCISKGLEVVVVHCDADVTKVMDTREVMKEIHSGTFGLAGKGGSDFRPGFEYIWKEIRQNDPLYGAPVIVFTDGGITVPERVPLNVRSSTLWVTASGEHPPTKDWGTHVTMNDPGM